MSLSLWVADAFVIVVLVAGGLTVAVNSGLALSSASAWLAAAAVLMAGWALRRLRAL